MVRSLRGAAKAPAQLRGDFAVAGQAEGADVFEIALAATLCDWENVVGVPERTAAGEGLHAIERESGSAGFASGALERGEDRDGVGAAEGAYAAVAGKDLIAEIAWVGAQTMLVDAVIGTEGAAAFGEDFELAPAAERAAVGAFGQDVGADAAAGQGAGNHVVGRILCGEPLRE